MSQPKILQFIHYYESRTPVDEVHADVLSRFRKQCAETHNEIEGDAVVCIEPSLFRFGQMRATVRAWKKAHD